MAVSTETRLTGFAILTIIGLLVIGTLGANNVISGWTATWLAPVWFVVLALPVTWLQARAEHLRFRVLIKRLDPRRK